MATDVHATATQLGFDALDAPAREPARAWRDWVHGFIPGLRVERMAASPGAARGMPLGEARLWHITTPAEQRLHGAGTSRLERNAFISLKLEGDSICIHEGREIPFRAGDLWMGRGSDEPFMTFAEGRSTLLMLSLPWATLRASHPQFARRSVFRFAAEEPGVGFLRELLLHTLKLGGRLDEVQQRFTLAAAVQLCGVPLASRSDAQSDDLRIARALAIIEDRLHAPDLCAPGVADAVGLSRRRLDELFVAAMGCTVAARIAEMRLTRAAWLLGDPASSHLTIAEIGGAVGFQDPAHFSRAFKARFQLVPTHWRSAKLRPRLAVRRAGAVSGP